MHSAGKGQSPNPIPFSKKRAKFKSDPPWCSGKEVDLGSTTYEAKTAGGGGGGSSNEGKVFAGVVVYVTKKCEAVSDEVSFS